MVVYLFQWILLGVVFLFLLLNIFLNCRLLKLISKILKASSISEETGGAYPISEENGDDNCNEEAMEMGQMGDVIHHQEMLF